MAPPPSTASRPLLLPGLILAYGAGTLISQVLILRELLVLAQGQELKTALGLWCWLFWTGLGSLAGGWAANRYAPGQTGLRGLMYLLGWLLPLTVLLLRAWPTLAGLPLGQTLPTGTAFCLFLTSLAPFCLVSGVFFPWACQVLASYDQFPLKCNQFNVQPNDIPYFINRKPKTENRKRHHPPQAAIGRVYYLETLGAALGVLVLQLFLLGRLSNLTLSLAIGLFLTLAALLGGRPRDQVVIPGSPSNATRWPPILLIFLNIFTENRKPKTENRISLAAGLGVLTLGAALIFSPRLEDLSRARQWPGRQIVATVDSPYALLSATREAEQYSFFANNLWFFTYPDPYSAEHGVHLGLLQHHEPRRVLLLGGGMAGLAGEILKTPSVTHLDYVELDPDLVKMAQQVLDTPITENRKPKTENRLHLIYQDARRFLSQTPERYDVILLSLPEPQNAQLNRYYTLEFFQIVARHLEPGGVFSFSLTGTETSLNPLRAAYLALAYHTLRRAFGEVLVFPGGRARFFAASTAGTLTADPERLLARLGERRLHLEYVREYYLRHDLAPARQEYFNRILQQQPPEINTDLNPRCYFYDLALSGAQQDIPLRKMLLALKGLPGYLPWAGLGLWTLFWLVVSRRRPGPRYLYQVLVTGLGAMGLEILTLILFQIHLGSLYRQMGLLIAACMGGMGLGAAWATRLASRTALKPWWVGAWQAGLAGLTLSLALTLPHLGDLPVLLGEKLTQVLYILLLALGGSAAGAVFALSAALWTQTHDSPGAKAGMLYAVDLLGATLGTLGLSLLILPVWGILPALYLLAALHAGAALMLAMKG